MHKTTNIYLNEVVLHSEVLHGTAVFLLFKWKKDSSLLLFEMIIIWNDRYGLQLGDYEERKGLQGALCIENSMLWKKIILH